MQKREEMNRYKKETLLPKSFFEKVNIPKAKHHLRPLLNSAIKDRRLAGSLLGFRSQERKVKNMSIPIMEEQQRKEIETIREKKITVKLSDTDCDRLARKCGEHGLTVGELIENFIGDLIDGTYSNGSDERDYADRWFERCWFGMSPEPTLLNHLLNLGYEPEDYLDMLDDIETLKADIKNIEKNIENPDNGWKNIVTRRYIDDENYIEVPCYKSVEEYIADEKEFLETYKEEKSMQEEMIKDMTEDWKPGKEPNMDEEIELIKKWVKEREDFINV